MKNKIICVYTIIIVVCIVCLSVLQIYSKYQMKIEQDNLESVYFQSVEFLDDVYSKNLDESYKQLEPRNALLSEDISMSEWKNSLEKEVDINPLIKIIKPKSSSDVSYIIHSDYPNETYVVKVTLLVNYLGNNVKRTGEIEYVETSNGFKVHKFALDVLGDKDNGRMVYYQQQ